LGVGKKRVNQGARGRTPDLVYKQREKGVEMKLKSGNEELDLGRETGG